MYVNGNSFDAALDGKFHLMINFYLYAIYEHLKYSTSMKLPYISAPTSSFLKSALSLGGSGSLEGILHTLLLTNLQASHYLHYLR